MVNDFRAQGTVEWPWRKFLSVQDPLNSEDSFAVYFL